MSKAFITAVVAIFLITVPALSQETADSLAGAGTLANCIRYALKHQPQFQQSQIDEEITERSIQSRLADWFPQLNLNVAVQHNPQLPVSVFQGTPIHLGQYNTSSGQLALTQTIFSRDALLASTTSSDARNHARQQTASSAIDLVAGVSKAYYAVLESREQIALLDEDIVRLTQSRKDAYLQYQSGVVDNIDYKRATIALNNSLAQRRQSDEDLKARIASLKQEMGYPPDRELAVVSDSTQMEREIAADTTQIADYENRIEYQLLQSQEQLQEDNLSYYEWAFLPSISFFASYALSYQNNALAPLYQQRYPSSSVGFQLTLPILTGARRYRDIQEARAELDRTEYDFANLRNSVNTEYQQALAAYKGSLNEYSVLKDNLALAKEVYNTISLQYRAGTKTYLDVITAETDLRSTQANYTAALYQVLSSKIDLQKALGELHY